jgi:hypothetical protein
MMVSAKLKKSSKKKYTKEQLELARRYESCWNCHFNELPKDMQIEIIENPEGRCSKEFTKKIIKEAEKKFDKDR